MAELVSLLSLYFTQSLLHEHHYKYEKMIDFEEFVQHNIQLGQINFGLVAPEGQLKAHYSSLPLSYITKLIGIAIKMFAKQGDS